MVFYKPEKKGGNSGIFIYALSTCVHCKLAKKLISESGTEYDFIDVDCLPESQRQECLKEMSGYNPAQTFPTLIIGSRIIVRDAEDEIRRLVLKLKKRYPDDSKTNV